MVTWHVQLMAAFAAPVGVPAKLSAMRPGAQWFGADDVVVLGHDPAPTVKFTYWGLYIDNGKIVRGTDGKGGAEAFNEPVVALTKENEKAVDGVVYVPGDNLLVLSQSKARGPSKSDAGLADTKLYNPEVLTIVASMREQSAALVATYPHLGAATVVYEVFSNRGAPVDETMAEAEFGLLPNERVIVVRGARFARALGSVFADLRQVEPVTTSKKPRAA